MSLASIHVPILARETGLDHLDHVAVAVDDVATAVSWYREHFRCRVAFQDETWALLELDNIRLAIVIPEQHPPHIAFRHRDAERFGVLHAHRDGSRSVYVEDPFGNAVEILDDGSLADSSAGTADGDTAERTHLAKLLILGATGISFVTSVSLWFFGLREEGLFVGIWVPSILSLGAFVLAGRRVS